MNEIAMGHEVRLAQLGDLAPAADTLAAAFRDYPWTRHVIPAADYWKRLLELQLLYLEYSQSRGIVAVTGGCDGVIALLPPEAPEPEPKMIGRIIELHGDRIDRLDHADPPADAWRLETLGVRPERQGRGLASALLDFALDGVARRGGRLVALDTSDSRNVRLYERHGFRIDSYEEGADRPPVWKMTFATTSRSGER
jgi:ribosomal protein S18 acetylase RimI-like enzyme